MIKKQWLRYDSVVGELWKILLPTGKRAEASAACVSPEKSVWPRIRKISKGGKEMSVSKNRS